MQVFHFTRIKLTSWYVAIIMIVSLSFSFFVYRGVMAEVNRAFRGRALRAPFYSAQFIEADAQLYEEIRHQVIVQLGIVNLIILVGSAAAGYFLAGRTLSPIEEMLEEQKRFVGDASHELRTPITSLKTEIEVSLRNKNLPPAFRAILESNLEEVNKMQSLTTHLLSLSRYERGDMVLDKEVVYLNELVKKVSKSLLPLALKKNVKLERKLKNVKIIANQASILELITILIDNAIKYSKPKDKVVIKVFEKGQHAFLEVEDSGVGIRTVDVEHIFSRFYRADSSRNKGVDGYGLGLSIAKSIAKLHGAKICVKSKLGKGSTFKVCF